MRLTEALAVADEHIRWLDRVCGHHGLPPRSHTRGQATEIEYPAMGTTWRALGFRPKARVGHAELRAALAAAWLGL